MPRRGGRTLSDHQLRPSGAERIGRYQVETPIGVGGFARVVRAYDESLDDSVAIKVLAENWAEDAEIRDRFLEEARLLRRVRSEYLVTVHDIGELPDGRPFFVMEFADAGTLAARLAVKTNVGLDAASARAIVEALADSLGALHGAGVIHRDVNPKNILIRHADVKRSERAVHGTQIRSGLVATDERLLLGDLGLAKDVVRAGAAVSMVGGTAHYIPPEQADPNGTVSPATDVYAATAVLWECLTATPPPDPPDLARAVAGLDEEWRTLFSTGLAADAADRFQSMGEWREAALDSLRTDAVLDGGYQPRRYHAAGDHNPYMGLEAFQREDADRFFGRNELIAELIERLRHKRMLVVAGPSGSGKSSLVRAGLIPATAGGSIDGSERWPIALLSPGADPLGELAYQLSKLMVGATQQSGISVTADELAADPNRGRLMAETVTDAAGGALIVVDQFEELFTQGPGRDGQQQFLDALAALVDATNSKVRIVAAVRADFYGTCASFPWLADKITDNQVLVGPMTPAELRQAIEEPAGRAGLAIEDGLVDTMLSDTGSDPGSLPLLSHALAETWRSRKGNTMTLDGYRAAGGVSGAIAQTANALYDEQFDAEERSAVRTLMLRLVNPGEGTPDTRRSLPIEAVFGNPDGVLARVTERMTDARLLTVGEESIEIAHEALIRTWPRLRSWIEENRDDLRTRQHIGRAASEWIDQGRTPDLLYRGTPLQSALDWAATRGDVLEPADQEFLDASKAAHDAEAAEKERVAARLRRIRMIAIGVLSGLTIVAAIASFVAYGALRETRSQFAQSLATLSAPLADENPRLALALAVEAIARGQADSIEARTTLVE
ncbi:MAG: protein kinase, partial [Acidimicrobiia bacterium]|nr:protein kinase [Acidimicrobiia bacterium]